MNPLRMLRTTRLVPLRVRFIAPTVGLAFAAAASATVAASAPPSDPPDTAPTDSAPTDSSPVDTVPTELPDGYVWLVDDTGVITVAVPEAWTDVDTAPAEVDGVPQPWIAAAPTSIDDFLGTPDESGVLFSAVAFDPDPAFLIEQFSLLEGCDEFTVEPYDERGLVGFTQLGSGCGEDGTGSWQLIIANPADQSFTALVQVQTSTDDDLTPAQIALDTFATVEPLGAVPGSSVPS